MADGFKALPCMGGAFFIQFNAQISVMVAALLCFIVRHTYLNCAVYEKDHPVYRSGHNILYGISSLKGDHQQHVTHIL